MSTSNPYRGFRYPAEVIQHAVWLYHCFSLNLRTVETILAARGIHRERAGESLVAVGHTVKLANSRGRDSVRDIAVGAGAAAADLGDVATDVDVLIVAIPLGRVPSLPQTVIRGLKPNAIVIDTGDYVPPRDGRIDEIESGLPETAWVGERLGTWSAAAGLRTRRTRSRCRLRATTRKARRPRCGWPKSLASTLSMRAPLRTPGVSSWGSRPTPSIPAARSCATCSAELNTTPWRGTGRN